MDLDRCMVYANGPNTGSGKQIYSILIMNIYQINLIIEIVIRVPFGGTYNVKLRPGVENFLASVNEFADLYGFTAATRTYGSKMFTFLDPCGKLFKNTLYQDSCTCGNNYAKDLTKLGDNVYIPTRTILIDDSDRSFACQPHNALLIPEFNCNEKDDSIFVHILKFLRELEHVEDIRPHLKKFDEEKTLFAIKKRIMIPGFRVDLEQ